MNPTWAHVRLLLGNDLRLIMRMWLSRKRSMLFSLILIGGLFTLFHVVSIGLFTLVRFEPTLGVETIAWAFFIFMMFGAAMANAIRLLFDHNDLDLLFSSPIPPRAVLVSRILTLFLSSLLSSGLPLIPLINGAAIGVGIHYLVAYPTWIFLALISAAVGTSAALGLVRLMGPRRARTWVQILGAVVGAAVYLAFQSTRFIPEGETNQIWEAFKALVGSPPGLLVARAGRGSMVDLLVLGSVAAVSTIVSGRLLARVFLSGVQESAVASKPRTGSNRPFRIRSGVFQATMLKELRLIRRDPLLLSQVLPLMMYVLPGLFGFRAIGGLNMLAPLGVIVGAQFSMTLTGVAVDGEEGLDLIRSSPLPEVRLRSAKVAAAMAIPLTVTFLLCSAVAVTGRPGLAAIAFITTAATAAACCWVRASEVRPSPRGDVMKRRSGRMTPSAAVGVLLILLATAGIGIFAADTLPLLGVLFLGITALGVIACFVFVSPKEFSGAAESA